MNSSDIKKETKSNLGVQRKPSLHHFSLEYGKVTSDPLGYLHIHKYVKYIFFCRPILLTIIVRKKIHPFKRYKNLSFTCLTSKMSFTGDTKTKKENKQKSIKFVVFNIFYTWASKRCVMSFHLTIVRSSARMVVYRKEK